MRDLCFVLMPFGRKPDVAGMVDFDAVYRDLIAPAIADADLEPLRADEEMTGGVIHKQMFERLILCRFAVADLTSANANVFYELGIRHAARPGTTVLVFAEGRGQLPFDVGPLRAMSYRLDAAGVPTDLAAARAKLKERLLDAKEAAEKDVRGGDSPLHELVDGDSFPEIARLKTDVFRDRVEYAAEAKRKLAEGRKRGVEALREIEGALGSPADVESAVLIDLLLSYRGVKAWAEMIDLVRRMPAPLAASVMVQEQLALALNRAGRGEEAERILRDLIANRGPSSETYGILGRVYKDRWDAAVKAGETIRARALLEKAIDAYSKGFEADWRDAYPGINAVTLMELREPPDPRREQMLPVVRYAATRRVAGGQADYWDFATLLELAVLARDERAALDALGNALALIRERWEPESTARNLRLIDAARVRRGEPLPWMAEVLAALDKAAR
ncbi:MAG: TRAFs-binding domain-containing protein [Acidobacteriota bacterium]